MTNLEVALISTIIASITTLLITYWRTRYTIKSQDLSKLIEHLCELISDLEAHSCHFYQGEDKVSRDYILGLKEKVLILVNHLNVTYRSFNKDEIASLISLCSEACTGGNFESTERTPRPEVQRKIMISSQNLQISLLKIRNRLY